MTTTKSRTKTRSTNPSGKRWAREKERQQCSRRRPEVVHWITSTRRCPDGWPKRFRLSQVRLNNPVAQKVLERK